MITFRHKSGFEPRPGLRWFLLGFLLLMAACDSGGAEGTLEVDAATGDSDTGGGGVVAPPFQPAGEGAPAMRFAGYGNVTEVGKLGLAVAVGGALTIEARELVGSLYGRSTDLRWRSLDPHILTVVPVREGDHNGHAQARLYGHAVGIAEVVVEGDSAAHGRLVVRVLPDNELAALDGVPVAAQFDVPFVADAFVAMIRVAIHDATGAVVAEVDALDGTRTGELARLTWDPEPGLTVDPSSLRATAADLLATRRLGVRWDGEPLFGSQLVIRTPEGADPSCPSGVERQKRPFWCDMAGVPARFGAPGERTGAMVTITQFYTEGGDLACPARDRSPHVQIWRRFPERLAWSHGGVVTLDDEGLLEAVAPGTTALWAGLGSSNCGTSEVSVLPRLEGTWRVDCEGGGQGVVKLVGGLDGVSMRSPQEAVFASLLPVSRARGESCMAGAVACVGDAAAWASTPSLNPSVFEVFRGPCSEAAPCHGAGITRCGKAAPTPLAILGPDRLRGGGCEYVRIDPDDAADICVPGLEGDR